MKRILIIAFCLLNLGWVAQAQFQSEYDALRIGTTELNGTARFMGVAGAMGALGGDASTLFYNPAGIGTYRSSELTFTGNFNWTNTNASGDKEGQFLFNMNNISYIGAINTGRDKGLVTFNFGLAYNRAKSFDRDIHYSNTTDNSMGDFLANYTQNSGNASNYNSDALVASDAYNNADVPWMSVLGWDGLLIANTNDGTNDILDEYESYRNYLTSQGYSGSLISSYTLAERGGINEYAFTAGGNISNLVQFGLSLVLVDLDYNMTSTFKETLADNSSLTYKNVYECDGSAFNMKIGAIVKPTSWLRIGAAFHTPSWYYITDSNQGSINSRAIEINKTESASTPWGYGSYYLNTPLKALGSLGFVIGQYGFIDVDYEYANYKGMVMKNNDDVDSRMEEQNDKIDANFKDTHTIRVGGEYIPFKNFAIRLGYSFSTSPIKEDAYRTYATNTVRTDTEFLNDKSLSYITSGIGYKFGRSSLDLTYVLKTKVQDFYPYNPTYVTNFDGPIEITSKHNQILLTYGVRF